MYTFSLKNWPRFVFFYAAKSTCLTRPMDHNGSTAQMRQRQRPSSKPGPSERAAIRSSSHRAAAFTRPSEADAYSFYPRSSNYGLALESHPQARQASSHVARLCPGRRGGELREPRWTQGTRPRLVPATRRVTEAGPHMQMSASTSRSVTVSWPIGPRARGLAGGPGGRLVRLAGYVQGRGIGGSCARYGKLFFLIALSSTVITVLSF